MTQIVLTSGTSWTVPADWNSAANTVEVIGGGAGGINTTSNNAGSGGGGYSKAVNVSLTVGVSVAYVIGAGGNQATAGGDTWFNGASLAASSVGAKGGSAGSGSTGGAGGAASAGVGSTKYSGGAGESGGRAGGGAAGLNGAGLAGSGGSGGTGDGGYGGAGGLYGSLGGSGTEWGSVGSGGGGGGSIATGADGGNGGFYGGGGGSSGTTGIGGLGAAGVIIITYTPLTGVTYYPGNGSVALTGYAPSIVAAQSEFDPGAGAMALTGYAPVYEAFAVYDYAPTVISQYANSPTIIALIEAFLGWINPGYSFDQFYDLIWNIDTAQGYGLDIWGRIVGVGRVLQVSGTAYYFGFEEATTGYGFNQEPFYGGGGVTSNFTLSDSAYRQLILSKALANICDGSIPAINQILINLFGAYGNAYVVDNENMSFVYHFTFPLNPVQTAIVYNSGVLPKPAGVSMTVYHP